MTRAEASALICQHGGEYVHAVNCQTGWSWSARKVCPALRWDPDLKLQKARSLQREGQAIESSRRGMVARFDLDQPGKTVHRLYTTAQLCQLLRIPGERIRGWVRAGLLQRWRPCRVSGNFDFRQITAVKTLWIWRKRRQGKPDPASLERLRTWFPDVEHPRTAWSARRQWAVLIRLGAGQLVEPSGQQHFNFNADAEDAEATATHCQFAPPWRQRGHDLEDAVILRQPPRRIAKPF